MHGPKWRTRNRDIFQTDMAALLKMHHTGTAIGQTPVFLSLPPAGTVSIQHPLAGNRNIFSVVCENQRLVSERTPALRFGFHQLILFKVVPETDNSSVIQIECDIADQFDRPCRIDACRNIQRSAAQSF